MKHHPFVLGGLLAAMGLTGLSGAAAASNSSSAGGTATFAQQVGAPPTYIFPLLAGSDSGNNNLTYLVPLMWRPLYWFGHRRSDQPTINYALSLGEPPTFSNAGRTVTITLRHFTWSTGAPVTSRDVAFWINLLRANRSDWCCYSPGDWIDHLVAMRTVSPSRFSLTFDAAYNRNWLVGNGLSQITPLPQAAWDKTSPTGAIGNRDRTTAGAQAVFHFLDGQSKDLATWDTNRLWQVVDGPWRLEPNRGFQPATGLTVLVPNTHYAGPDRARLAKLEEVPFTNATAELNALLAGQVDYGYLPFTDVALAKSLIRRGFQVKPWLYWGFSDIQLNFANPKAGPIFDQLAVRQALQRLIDEPSYIKTIFKGYGWPTYGPVPVVPANPYASGFEKKNPYPYSIAAAGHLLGQHGWRVRAGGTTTCAAPGTGSHQCGAGIASGAKLAFTLVYSSGTPAYAQEMQAFKSAASRVGIQIALSQAPYNEVLTSTAACNPKSGSGCSWQLFYLGAPSITYVPVYYPTGGTIFGTGAPINVGHYSNRTNDANIRRSHLEPGLGALVTYQNFVAAQLPELWMPNSDYQISVISDRLHGITAQDPTGHLYPEGWTLGKP
ncbi:MAG TPA: ABC transporter substrate-binding protein [Candidatus Micrarchaeia archaeon]|nr:ABC transporter substrate-binding protein [Candidatus Micrarchaeia archaeon]